MAFYTVHVDDRRDDVHRRLVTIRDGFSWTAFLFTILWALWHRMWAAALVLLILQMGIEFLPLGQGGKTAAGLGLMVAFGLVAADVRRAVLARRGYRECGVVEGRNRTAAEVRWHQMGDEAQP